MNFEKLQKEIYEINKANGWHEIERPPLEYHAMIQSEIAEATEALRNKKPPVYFLTEQGTPVLNAISGIPHKPEGFAVELADVVIRILDYFEASGFNYVDVRKEEMVQYILYSGSYREVIQTEIHYLSFLHYMVGMATENIFLEDKDDEISRLSVVLFFIGDFFRLSEWSLEETIRLKLVYNRTRSWRHDGKRY